MTAFMSNRSCRIAALLKVAFLSLLIALPDARAQSSNVYVTARNAEATLQKAQKEYEDAGRNLQPKEQVLDDARKALIDLGEPPEATQKAQAEKRIADATRDRDATTLLALVAMLLLSYVDVRQTRSERSLVDQFRDYLARKVLS